MATRAKSNGTPDEQPLRVRFDRFELDEANARLLRDGTVVALTPTPFAVLCVLVRKPGCLITANALLDEVWGHQFVSDSVLRSAISDLRTVLQDDARKPRFIETVSRRGYRFISSVDAIAAISTTASSCLAETQTLPPTFIGRTKELVRLRSAWQAATSGKRAIVWIAGEAGVGKTALVERFQSEVGEGHCARGHCVEQHGGGEPYLPVLEALTTLCRRDPTLPDLIRAVAPSWLSRLPWLCTAADRDAVRAELVAAADARMLREMGELLDRYTHDRPLLLITEDLHWSDQATIHLIDYLARRRGPARLLWLASFRLTDIVAGDHPLNALRRELRLHGLCEQIVLDGFSELEVAEFLRHRMPALACDEAFVGALHDRTDGLPLFVADVVDNVIDGAGPTIPQEASTSRSSCVVPERLTGIVERYVEELTPDQRAVLDAASVCGADFSLSALANALGADVASIAETCEELVRGQRWLKEVSPAGQTMTADPRYGFRQSHYREVLCKRMSRFARAQLHDRMASWQERERSGRYSAGAAHKSALDRSIRLVVPA